MRIRFQVILPALLLSAILSTPILAGGHGDLGIPESPRPQTSAAPAPQTFSGELTPEQVKAFNEMRQRQREQALEIARQREAADQARLAESRRIREMAGSR